MFCDCYDYMSLRGLNQVMLRTYNFENLAILDLSSFSYVREQVSRCYIAWKNWIISVAMFTQYRIVKQSVAETDPVQCEQEQVLPCVSGIKSYKNGTK